MYNFINMLKRNGTKYEIVIAKSIIAHEYFLRDGDSQDWLETIDRIYEENKIDPLKTIGSFIVSTVYDNRNSYNGNSFLPQYLNNEIDNNIEKKFVSFEKIEEENNSNSEDEEENNDN